MKSPDSVDLLILILPISFLSKVKGTNSLFLIKRIKSKPAQATTITKPTLVSSNLFRNVTRKITVTVGKWIVKKNK